MTNSDQLMPEEKTYNVKRLLHKDILMKHRNTNDFSNTPIIMKDNEQKSDLMFFEVVQTSDQVTEINQGDVVVVPWARTVPPFILNGERVTITSEDEVYGVVND